MRSRRYMALALSFVIVATMMAQVPFAVTPSWTSADVSNYSTGCAWADINKDGWLDLVVANGNDMARQRVVVYYNTGAGSLPTTPNWQSTDVDYHGHLSIGDVNRDGYPDVAVSVYIGAAGFSQKGRVKLYMNNNGTLSSLPSWISKDSLYTFSCAFGDADGDGDLDLAVACGESYNNRAEQNRIYFNTQGRLDSLPRWKSREAGYSYDVAWADFDNDGDLDLVFANERGPNRVYMNYGDSIGTAAVWSSADGALNANSLFVGDVNGDGLLDLAVSDNNQLGGTGRFKLYRNHAGRLDSIPFWTSAFSGYGSGINLADIDNDGDRDLLTGGWWNPLRIYVNAGGNFTSTPQWTSSTNSVVEAIVCGDYDNDGLDTLNLQFVGDGTRKLYYLPRAPIQRLLRLAWNGDPDSAAPYCYDLENGWISFMLPPRTGTLIDVRAVVSRDLDFAVSNWDPTIGNYVFRNTSPVSVAEHPTSPVRFVLHQNYPNPFNPTTTIRFSLESVNGRTGDPARATLKVYDILGREVRTLVNESLKPGSYEVTFTAEGLASGVYLYQLRSGGLVQTRSLMLLR
jgi:hypothetical protein